MMSDSMKIELVCTEIYARCVPKTPAAPAALSPELPQLKAMAANLAAVRQSVARIHTPHCLSAW
jgi:hypothetical protein